jgi:regulatory protein
LLSAQRLTPNQALPKIKQYCAYQERSHSEVRDKLYSFGITKIDIDEIISKLIEDNYLNEERFAIHFAGGKFRIKHWGKVKIKYQLKQKQVSDFCIKKALAAIDNTAYKKTLYKLADAKIATLQSEKNSFTRKKKLQDHLLQKGFEMELVKVIVNDY